MALTQNDWIEKTVNGRYTAKCTITATTAEEFSATLKTPRGLDTTKAFTLTVNPAGTTLDGSTLPCDIYGGYDDDFALGVVTSTLTVTSGFLINAAAIADVKSSIGSVIIDPLLNIADDPDDIVRGATVPYYGFVLVGASSLAAEDAVYIITQ